MVGPEIDYVKVNDHATNRNYILAKSRLPRLMKKQSNLTLY